MVKGEVPPKTPSVITAYLDSRDGDLLPLFHLPVDAAEDRRPIVIIIGTPPAHKEA